jgi:hypothetical protein
MLHQRVASLPAASTNTMVLQVQKAKRNMRDAAEEPFMSWRHSIMAQAQAAAGHQGRTTGGGADTVVLILSGRQQQSQLTGTPAKMCQH